MLLDAIRRSIARKADSQQAWARAGSRFKAPEENRNVPVTVEGRPASPISRSTSSSSCCAGTVFR